MKKSLALIVSLLLVAALFSLAGCSKSKSSETSSSNQPKASEQAGSNDASDLQKLFKSASEVKGVSYDSVTTMKGPQGTMTSQGKFYISGKKVRMEMEAQGMQSIILYNGSGDTYMYTPSTNTAIKTPMPKEKAADQWAKSEEDLAKFKVVGHEKMGGFDCLVVTTSDTQGNIKMWLREDIGLPVRVESGDENNKTVIEYKNFNIGAQAESLFELPAGAQVMDMSSLQPGMPPGQNMPQIPQPQGAQ